MVIVVAAVLFFNHRSNKVQINNDAAKMQRCDDAGIFTKLSGTKTKAWGFGSGGNMMFSGSEVCIYDGFGKPKISKIIYEKKGEAEIYVQTNNSILIKIK
ncbi:hypothetical protein J2T14_000048 [Paenibacillus harenae]|nr:hypothetical protein [Paenibacillus harenae]